jgi:O-methyltransferase
MKLLTRDFKSVATALKQLLYNLAIEITSSSKGIKRSDIWKEDAFFVELRYEVMEKTFLNANKLFMLYQFARGTISLDGDISELGVYKGGTAKLLARVSNKYTTKKVFLFDTFEGLPQPDPTKDIYYQKGDMSDTDINEVKNYMSDCQNIVFYKGLFSDTLCNVSDRIFSMVHIDCDLYSSTFQACEFFYPRLVQGGVMIFDDYGFISCVGAKKAVDEFFSKPGRDFPVCLPSGQCVVIKQKEY